MAARTISGMNAKSIRDNVDDQLTAIDDQVHCLEASTASFRGRPLNWVDVTTLTQVREQLGLALEGVRSAEAAADLKNASRRVASEIRQRREAQ
jgi:hypothetical protein